jgi:hypothetical protein
VSRACARPSEESEPGEEARGGARSLGTVASSLGSRAAGGEEADDAGYGESRSSPHVGVRIGDQASMGARRLFPRTREARGIWIWGLGSPGERGRGRGEGRSRRRGSHRHWPWLKKTGGGGRLRRPPVEEVAAAIAAFQAPAGGERREGVELVFFPDVLTDRSCVPKK